MIAELADSELLIADGHHRYETARTYADAIGGDGAHRYTLMALVSLEDPGLTVFGYHRLLSNLGEPEAQEALARGAARQLRGRGGAARATSTPPASKGSGVFGYVDSHHRKGFRLRLKDPAMLAAAIPEASARLPRARRRDPRGADASRRARDERRGHRGQARDRLHRLRRARRSPRSTAAPTPPS